ncbi:p53 and DNA damage-regulated protein 1 [Cimex lectularius]|uniref:P53 and DNA damage-regulated protein 1 n=1 Tax=Cimex lectularius TaxID=79782 RepID=A0A8I6TFT6_CIMLE|nr:p53 and DNA damage-regulated protein 1 [Cimex lectularius]
MEDLQKSLRELVGIESLAEEILRDKAEVVSIDKKRNSNREGIRQLMKSNEKKTWMTLGPILVKMPSDKVRNMLEKDQKVLDIEINKVRSDLKVKVNKLRDLEYNDPLKGFDLKPLSRQEMSAVGQALGRHS